MSNICFSVWTHRRHHWSSCKYKIISVFSTNDTLSRTVQYCLIIWNVWKLWFSVLMSCYLQFFGRFSLNFVLDYLIFFGATRFFLSAWTWKIEGFVLMLRWVFSRFFSFPSRSSGHVFILFSWKLSSSGIYSSKQQVLTKTSVTW